jgi:hypothetical protein
MAEVRILAPGEVSTAAEAQHALRQWNMLLDMWRLDSLLVYAIEPHTFTLQANKGSYTIGIGGDWNVERPVQIDKAGWLDASVSPTLEIPMKVLTDEEWEALHVKGLASDYSHWLYYDRNFPFGTVHIWPVPAANRGITLYLWEILSQIASLGDSITFPPGYQAAMKYNLATWLAPSYGVTPLPKVEVLAQETKAALQQLNVKVPIMHTDPALMRRHGARWNGQIGDWIS